MYIYPYMPRRVFMKSTTMVYDVYFGWVNSNETGETQTKSVTSSLGEEFFVAKSDQISATSEISFTGVIE